MNSEAKLTDPVEPWWYELGRMGQPIDEDQLRRLSYEVARLMGYRWYKGWYIGQSALPSGVPGWTYYFYCDLLPTGCIRGDRRYETCDEPEDVYRGTFPRPIPPWGSGWTPELASSPEGAQQVEDWALLQHLTIGRYVRKQERLDDLIIPEVSTLIYDLPADNPDGNMGSSDLSSTQTPHYREATLCLAMLYFYRCKERKRARHEAEAYGE